MPVANKSKTTKSTKAKPRKDAAEAAKAVNPGQLDDAIALATEIAEAPVEGEGNADGISPNPVTGADNLAAAVAPLEFIPEYGPEQAEFEDLDWRAFESHPIAQVLPMMSDEEAARLKWDIRRNGQLVPISLVKRVNEDGSADYLIVDGRNRHLAMCELDVRPSFVIVEEGEALQKVISYNLSRRQLNGGQLAASGAKARDWLEREIRESGQPISGEIRETIGALFGVSGRYLDMATKLMNEDPIQFDAVFDGSLKLTEAMRTLKDRLEGEERDAKGEGTGRSEPTLEEFDPIKCLGPIKENVLAGRTTIPRRKLYTLLLMLEFQNECHGFSPTKFKAWCKESGRKFS